MGLSKQYKERAEEYLNAAKKNSQTGGPWVNVYLDTGLSIELMMKACRVKKERLSEWPPRDSGAKWHNLKFLADRCGLADELKRKLASSADFKKSWLEVKDWEFRRRYPVDRKSNPKWEVTEVEARGMLRATIHHAYGVFPWLVEVYERI